MKTVLLGSIREVEPDVWNSIVGRNRLICRHEYLLAVESSKINDCRYYYPIVYDDSGRMIAHTCLYYISTELDSFAQGFTKKAIAGIRKFWKSFLILRSVECGTPVALGNTISFADGIDKAAALEAIVGETERLAAGLGVPVVLFRDFYEADLPFFDQLRRRGYQTVMNLPTALLTLRWRTFDEYLSSLRTRYRRRLCKHLADLGQPGITVEIVGDYAAEADALAALWANVYGQAREYKREMLGADFFRNIHRHLGDRSAVLMIRREGVPIAFTLLLYDDDTLIPLFCGLDYRYNDAYSLFFNLMTKEVEIAIQSGKPLMDLGITTLFPKQLVGAEKVVQYMYMKHLNRVLNRVVPKLFKLMTPADSTPETRVFSQSGHTP